MLTHISVRGAREHNLKGDRRRYPAREPDGHHRPVAARASRSLAFDTIYAEGQRRYVESLSRLRAPVPRDDAEARRRAYRRPLAGHLDRAEDHQPQPALDRRHRHRNLRLHAPAVGARRRPLLARDRPADRGAAGQPDGRPRHGAARRQPPLPARPGRPRPQGRVSQGARRVAEGGLHPRPHRRRVLRDRGRPRARQEIQARHRGGGRPHRRPRRHRAAPRRQLRDRAQARRRPRLSRPGRPSPHPPGASATGDAAATRRQPLERRGLQARLRPPRPHHSSPRNSPARSPASPSPRSSRGCSASTRRRAPARPATASARSWCSTRTSSSPTTASRSPRARSCPGPSPTRPRPYYMQVLCQPRPRLRLRPRHVPWKDLPEEAQRVILHGTGGRPVTLRFIDGTPQLRGQEAVRRRHRQPQPPHAPDRERVDARGAVALPVSAAVRGLPRRPPQARGAGGQDRRRGHLACPPAAASPTRSPGSPRSTRSSPPTQNEIAKAILKEINERLGFLHNVGLDYLHLDRTSGTLSRRREPAHPPRLADRLRPVGRPLRPRRALDRPPPEGQRPPARNAQAPASGLGNTVLVVEHDEDAIRHADHVIDMGPGAGVHGGEVVCAGHARRPARLRGPASPPTTSPAAARSRSSPPAARASGKHVTVHGATANNLQNVTAAFPLGTFTCVTGVSGSRQVQRSPSTRSTPAPPAR